LRSVARGDALVLWLRPDDVALLAGPPPPSSRVFLSGLMGGMDAAPLPPSWRQATRLSYPVEMPDRRRIGVEYALGWMEHHHIPVLDARVQADTYAACGMLREVLAHMAGSFTGDYLVEQMEGMLEHEIVSGYYPRLSLAPNERFASKGGYLVHFSGSTGEQVSADSEWIVP